MSDVQPYTGNTGLIAGQRQTDAADFIPPRVKVVQQMSAENTNKVADPGDLFNVLTGEDYGTSVKVAPLFMFKQRIFLVRKERRPAINAKLSEAGLDELPEGDGLKCRSFDMFTGHGYPGIDCNDCPLSKWDERSQKPPFCSETYNLAAVNESGDLAFYSFLKTSAKTGRQLVTMARLKEHGGRRWHDGNLLSISTVQRSNDLGTFYLPQVAVTTDPVPEELKGECLSWLQELSGRTIDVTPLDDEDTEVPPDVDGADVPF